MSDRELLNLAAKAAGYLCAFEDHGKWHASYGEGIVGVWNPLADGDTLRLAVKLNMAARIFANVTDAHAMNMPPESTMQVSHHSGPFAATRRAIVCAAAEIGRGMS